MSIEQLGGFEAAPMVGLNLLAVVAIQHLAKPCSLQKQNIYSSTKTIHSLSVFFLSLRMRSMRNI